MSVNLENTAVATALAKVSFHPNPKERQCQRMLKLLNNYTHFTCQQGNSQTLQARLQQYVNRENPQMYKLDLEKAEEPEIKLPTSVGSSKNGREFQENIYFCFTLKPLTMCITTNYGKFFKQWEYHIP